MDCFIFYILPLPLTFQLTPFCHGYGLLSITSICFLHMLIFIHQLIPNLCTYWPRYRTNALLVQFILTIAQRDATQSSLFIILRVYSTCFGCQPHPSSGVHKTVTTASSTGHIFCVGTSLQLGQAWPRWRAWPPCRKVATQKIWPVHSTCFGCQPHPSSGVHKTVTTASSTGHIFFV